MTDTDLANMALSRLGEPRIGDIAENAPAAIACRTQLEAVRDSLLRSHPWNFAVTRAELSQTDAPAFGWTYAYTLPADFVRLLTLNGIQAAKCTADYAIESGQILTHADPAQITYVRRITDPTAFDPLFTEVLTLRLAAAIAMDVSASPEKSAAMENLAAIRMRDAAFADSRENRAIVASPINRGRPRAGAEPYNWGDVPLAGLNGEDGWSPVLSLVSRGDDLVMAISWTGGDGTAPTSGYVGSSGTVADINNAVAFTSGGGSMSAAEILAELLTVDGAGSGLDADLLDGNSSAAFATAANLTSHTDATTGAHGMTAFGASLVDDSSASAARTTLGLVIGTDVLGYDTALNRTGSGDQTFITQQGNTVLRTAFSGASLYTPYAFVADGGLTLGQTLDQKFTRGGTNLVHLTDGFSGYAQLRLGGIKLTPIAISALPTASASEGWRYEVNNANAPSVGATVASGGSAKCEVRSNGTNWIVLQIF